MGGCVCAPSGQLPAWAWLADHGSVELRSPSLVKLIFELIYVTIGRQLGFRSTYMSGTLNRELI